MEQVCQRCIWNLCTFCLRAWYHQSVDVTSFLGRVHSTPVDISHHRGACTERNIGMLLCCANQYSASFDNAGAARISDLAGESHTRGAQISGNRIFRLQNSKMDSKSCEGCHRELAIQRCEVYSFSNSQAGQCQYCVGRISQKD